MAKYRLIKDVVEAIQFTGGNCEEIALFINDRVAFCFDPEGGHYIHICSNEKYIKINPGDYIIRWAHNLYNICEEEKFVRFYRPIEDKAHG